MQGCFLSGGESAPSLAPVIGPFRVGDKRVFERVYHQTKWDSFNHVYVDSLWERYDILIQAERILVQDGSKRMIFSVSRPEIDDFIATDTLIETAGGFEERASVPFAWWFPPSWVEYDSTTKVVISHGERFALVSGVGRFDVRSGGHRIYNVCLMDSTRGPIYVFEEESVGVSGFFQSTSLTLRSLNGKSIDVKSLRGW